MIKAASWKDFLQVFWGPHGKEIPFAVKNRYLEKKKPLSDVCAESKRGFSFAVNYFNLLTFMVKVGGGAGT